MPGHHQRCYHDAIFLAEPRGDLRARENASAAMRFENASPVTDLASPLCALRARLSL